MKILLTFLASFLTLAPLHSSVWHPTPPGSIGGPAIPAGPVCCSRTPSAAGSNRFIATYLWGSGNLKDEASGSVNASQGDALYSLYDTTTQTWSAPATIPMFFNYYCHNHCSAIFNAYGDGINLIVGESEHSVVYTTFTGSAFTTAGHVPGSEVTASGAVIYPSYNSFYNKFIATWVNFTSNFVPQYAIYDPTGGGSWTTAATLNQPADINNMSLVYSANNPTNGDVLITWNVINASSSPVGPYFAYSSLTSLAGATGTPIPGGASASIETFPFPTFDPRSGNYIVTWVGTYGELIYTIFDGATWTTPLQIPGTSTALDVSGITSSVSSSKGTVLFTWYDGVTNIPTYITYNSRLANPWGTPSTIPSSVSNSSNFPLNSDYDPVSELFMVAWPFSNSVAPLYDTFSLCPTTTTVTTSPNPSSLFQLVTLSAHVECEDPYCNLSTLTGRVTFYLNDVFVGEADVNVSGDATLTTEINCQGDSTIKAVYSGDSTFEKSFGTTTHTVNCLQS